MDKLEVIRLFYKELEDASHLYDIQTPIYWGGFNRRKRALGICIYSRRNDDYEIQLSENIVRCSDEQIIDTIRHEIAHAIAGIDNNHNHVWKRVARDLGASPTATTVAPEFNTESDYKWYLVNTLDGTICGKYLRKPRRDFSVRWLKGKPETKGKLVLIKRVEFENIIHREVQRIKAARAA